MDTVVAAGEVGTVIDLDDWRLRRQAAVGDPVERIKRALEEFAPVVSGLHGVPLDDARSEIVAITRAVDKRKLSEAASRAEQLALRLRRLA